MSLDRRICSSPITESLSAFQQSFRVAQLNVCVTRCDRPLQILMKSRQSFFIFRLWNSLLLVIDLKPEKLLFQIIESRRAPRCRVRRGLVRSRIILELGSNRRCFTLCRTLSNRYRTRGQEYP